MSSWRNVLPRREHRERSQPHHRERLGLLEKKKDYRLRARDYHRKQDRIRALREKAAFRNPEEFYYGMIRGKNEGEADGLAPRTEEERLLSVSRDASYVHAKAAAERAKTSKLRAQLHALDGSASVGRQHTFFVDSAEAFSEFTPAKRLDVPESLLSRAFNRPRTEELEKMEVSRAMRGSASAAKQSIPQYRELLSRVQREKRLSRLACSIDFEKQLMAKGAKKKVQEKDEYTGAPAVYRWRQQRQR